MLRVLAALDRPLALPPVPPGHVVTVSVSSDSLVGLLVELELRGYRSVGVHPALLEAPDVNVIDLLVPATLPREAPTWWSAAVSCAEHVFRLEFGPVRAALRPLLAAHARGAVPAVAWPRKK
ncbi:MAG: hypothetical protein M3O70_04580 [Actinomycetota bacterium]|nr:hypothetical protein [Actinomycetota bacterium]